MYIGTHYKYHYHGPWVLLRVQYNNPMMSTILFVGRFFSLHFRWSIAFLDNNSFWSGVPIQVVYAAARPIYIYCGVARDRPVLRADVVTLLHYKLLCTTWYARNEGFRFGYSAFVTVIHVKKYVIIWVYLHTTAVILWYSGRRARRLSREGQRVYRYALCYNIIILFSKASVLLFLCHVLNYIYLQFIAHDGNVDIRRGSPSCSNKWYNRDCVLSLIFSVWYNEYFQQTRVFDIFKYILYIGT